MEFLTAIAIVASLGALYIGILGATARMFHNEPADIPREAQDDEGALQTVIRTGGFDIPLRTAADVFSYLNPRIGDAPIEYMFLLLTDTDNRLAVEIQCTDREGGYVRFPKTEVIIEKCVQNGVHSIFIAHNHPNGTMHPSTDDIVYTMRLAQKLQKAGVSIQDHIIIAKNKYYSIKENDPFNMSGVRP